jgi:hypothetical protein
MRRARGSPSGSGFEFKNSAATAGEEKAVVAAVYAKETVVRPLEPTAVSDPFARMEYFREPRTQRISAGGGKVGSGCGIGTTEEADHGAARNTPT